MHTLYKVGITLSLIFLFNAGCSDSDAEGNGPGPERAVEMTTMQGSSYNDEQTSLTLREAFYSENMAEDTVITLSAFSLESSCAMNMFSVNPAKIDIVKNQISTINMQASFSAPCDAAQFRLTAQQSTTIEGSKNSIEEPVSFVITPTEAIEKNLIVNPAVLTVQNGSQAQNITVTTLNDASQPVSAEVGVSYLRPDEQNRDYGTFDNYNITTDANGQGHLVYTAPQDVNAVDGESREVVLTRKDTNETVILTLNFVYLPGEKNLIITPAVLTVENGSQTQSIAITTLNDDSQPVAAEVSVSYLRPDEQNREFGAFNTYHITTDTNGQGSILYIAPQDISTIDGESREVVLTRKDTNETAVLTLNYVYIPGAAELLNYKTVVDQPQQINVNENGKLTVRFVSLEDENVLLPSAQVLDVNVTTIMPESLLLIDEEGQSVSKIEYADDHNKTVLLQAGRVSGSAVLEISALINDGKEQKRLTKTLTITIASGSVDKISINYAGYLFKEGLFYEKYTIHAVDRYNNPPSSVLPLHVGVVGGLVKSAHNDDFYLYLAKLVGIQKEGQSILMKKSEANPIDFSLVDTADTVVFLANSNGDSADFLGGWQIGSVEPYALHLNGLYYGDNYEYLTAVIGNASRTDTKCSQTPYTIDMMEGSDIQMDANGTATVTLKYDPFFVAKDVYLYAATYLNSNTGEQKRVGTASREKLRGAGYQVDKPEGITCDVNQTCTGTLVFYTEPEDGMKIPLVDIEPVFSYSQGNGCSITKMNYGGKTDCAGAMSFKLTNFPVSFSGGSVSEQPCSVEWSGGVYYEYDAEER